MIYLVERACYHRPRCDLRVKASLERFRALDYERGQLSRDSDSEGEDPLNSSLVPSTKWDRPTELVVGIR